MFKKDQRMKNGARNAGPRKMVKAALIILATLLVSLVAFNLSLGNMQVDEPIPHAYDIHDPQFTHTMGFILGPDLLRGNRIQTLVNGEEIFPAMLQAIRGAQHTITLETYIFFTGTIAREFADALTERARAGVRVKILLDWVGGQINDELIDELKESGIEIRWYHPPYWYYLPKFNNRTHRKLLIVDGKTGFTGGADIADKWRGDAQDADHWRDTHFRLEGPVVGQLQGAFVDNWVQSTGELLHGTRYFPPLDQAGTESAQVFMSSPGGGSESMQLMYLLSIASAAQTLRISTPYFIPDEVAVAELAAAARRGVRVQIIVPGKHIDWEFVRRASRDRWGALLDAGVEIYEYQPTMYHVKLLIADGVWVSLGSSNFDPRSFAINDEANVNVYDEAFAKQQIDIFERDLQKSKRVTLDEWKSRSWSEQALDFGAAMFGAQL